jgi:DNA-binding IclR family transcriptional regulator
MATASKTTRPGAANRGTGSLRKALRLISGLAEAPQEGLRLTEIVGRTNLDPATAHRMLACLVEEGFLQKRPDKRYRLGRRIFELGLVAGHTFNERVHAHRALCRLAETVGATAVLSARSGDETVYIDRVEGPEQFAGLRAALGTRLPIGIGAGGVALLAAMAPDAADALVRANAARYRRFDPQAPNKLRRRIEEAKRQGFALTESFLNPGVGAIGVVVPEDPHSPGFALSIVTSADRLSARHDLAPELRLAALEISAAIRHAGAGPFFTRPVSAF